MGRRPAGPVLHTLGRVIHDLGVEADPGHDREAVDVVHPGAQGTSALALVWVDDQPSDIDGAVLAGEGRGRCGGQGVDREAEVAGQQVPGTAWKETQRHAGGDELLRHRPDGPVAAEGAHQTGASASIPAAAAASRRTSPTSARSTFIGLTTTTTSGPLASTRPMSHGACEAYQRRWLGTQVLEGGHMNSISDRADGVSGSAKRAAARTSNHPLVEWGARLGYGASGVLHLLLAYLTAQIALGGSGKQASQSGALATIAEESGGHALLWVIAVGFTLLALWQLTELVTRHDAFDKAKAGGKLVLYGAFAWTSFTFASGGRTSSNKQTRDFTVSLMEAPAGRGLVGLVGGAIIGIAAYHVHKGWRDRFLKDLQEQPGRWAVITAKVGYIGKGVVLVAVGILFITAAIHQRAGKVTGLDGALKSMRDLPAGTVILLGMALGLAAYGGYSFVRARYARV